MNMLEKINYPETLEAAWKLHLAPRPDNAPTVISTFAGCGGSSLGYSMAGFKELLAVEWDDNAVATFKLNFPDVPIYHGDICSLTVDEALKLSGLKPGELDVLDGSPPCQGFSTAGKRKMSDSRNQLFTEFVRLLRGLQPRVFIMENVSGMVKGKMKIIFAEIMRELKASGYRVSCRVLDAQWFGVPQQRQRTIFVGVREGVGIEPGHPQGLAYRYSVRDALPWIAGIKLGEESHHRNSGCNFERGKQANISRPCPTVRADPAGISGSKHTIEARVIHDTSGKWAQDLDVTDKPCPAVTVGINSINSNHFKVETDISRFAIGAEWDNLQPGEQSKRYFSLIKPALGSPCPTIQSTHGGSSIASVVHPTEKRKFTIAELKRICAFPDAFLMTGTYAQQWARLGNSVPPLFMKAIASHVHSELLKREETAIAA